MKLKVQLFLTVLIVCIVTPILILAKINDISFNGLVLNKWTILIFYCVAVAELIHIKMKGSKSCTSSCQEKQGNVEPHS